MSESSSPILSKLCVHGPHFKLFTWWSWSWITIRLQRPCWISIVFIIVVITVSQKRISISKVSHFGTAEIKYSPRKMETGIKSVSTSRGRGEILSKEIAGPQSHIQLEQCISRWCLDGSGSKASRRSSPCAEVSCTHLQPHCECA